jgi:hypothetical protein
MFPKANLHKRLFLVPVTVLPEKRNLKELSRLPSSASLVIPNKLGSYYREFSGIIGHIQLTVFQQLIRKTQLPNLYAGTISLCSSPYLLSQFFLFATALASSKISSSTVKRHQNFTQKW